MRLPDGHDPLGRGEDDLPAELVHAEELYEQGQVEAALDLLIEADLDDPDALSLEAVARLDLDDLEGARDLVLELRELEDFDEDPRARWAAARLALREWQVEEAERLLRGLAREQREASVLEELALCADLRGALEEADALYAEAARLDPSVGAPPRLEEEAFAAVVQEALQRLPAEFRGALERVEIVVDAMPTRMLVSPRGDEDLAETPPDLLGLFVGANALEQSDELFALPPRIHLFQRNLERSARDHDELVEEIRVTLYHEIAHLLGYDEDGVEGLGLG